LHDTKLYLLVSEYTTAGNLLVFCPKSNNITKSENNYEQKPIAISQEKHILNEKQQI